jgi:hypothetical protein
LSDLFAFAAFVLAIAGVLIALLAYGFSIRRPRLALDVQVGDGTHGFQVPTAMNRNGLHREIANDPQTALNLTLLGKNNVSARNPAVRVTIMEGLVYFHGAQVASAGWSQLGMAGASDSVQWDGGANYVVHGGWSRGLPPLPLAGTQLEEIETRIATVLIEWVADGIAGQSRFVPLVVS